LSIETPLTRPMGLGVPVLRRVTWVTLYGVKKILSAFFEQFPESPSEIYWWSTQKEG
jgi:hypothetical protein